MSIQNKDKLHFALIKVVTQSFILVLLLLQTAECHSQGKEQQQAADVKAVFMYNFTHYIEWDSTVASRHFVIGILGSSPIRKSLLEIAENNLALNRQIEIVTYNSPEEIGECQMLFIPEASKYPLSSILSNTDNNTLTVSEHPGYASRGTNFNFIIVKNKIKFEVNLKALAQKNIKVSSQLLKLAKIVQ